MTVTEKDLFLAILAMDSYNRGYGSGLNDFGAGDQDGLGGQGSQIGTASVILDDVSEAAQAAGFYAVAYDAQYGTVVSYRGTDFTPAVDITTGSPQAARLTAPNSPVPKYPRRRHPEPVGARARGEIRSLRAERAQFDSRPLPRGLWKHLPLPLVERGRG